MQSQSVKIRNKTLVFFVFDTVNLVVEACLYMLSFWPMIFLVWSYGMDAVWKFLLMVSFGWLIAMILFTLFILLLRRVLAPKIPTGRFLLSSKKMLPWFFADQLNKMMQRSFFYKIVFDTAPLRYWYLRGMGAKIHPSVILSHGVLILDPWTFQAGEDVILGEGAILSGHMVNHEVVTIGKIVIGNNTLIGGRALIGPDVTIGNNATISAQAALPRGTVVNDEEIWSSQPAQKVSFHDFSLRK